MGLEVTHEHTTEIKLDMQSFTIERNATNPGFQLTVMEEPLPSADMEEEVTSNPDKLLESFPEESKKKQLKFEEECSNVGNDVEELLSNIHVNAGSQFTVKKEPLPSADMEEEVTSNPDKLLKIECFPEETNIQLKFEEEYSIVENDMEELLSNIHVNAGSQFMVKEEPLPSADMEEEVTSNPDKLLEVKSSTEDSTNSQLKSEEDYSVAGNYVEGLLSIINVKQTKSDGSKMRFSCNNCNKIFNTKRKLISHKKKSHSQLTGGQYSNKKHTATTGVIENKTIHDPKKNLVCHVCDKQFHRKKSLVLHLRTHTDEKSFACTVCHKQFNRKWSLSMHMSVHNTIFACIVCDEQFSHKCNLVSHVRTHTNKKPFPCNVCDKQFCYEGFLVEHMRIHTGEKLFACNVCDKQFTRKCSVVIHTKSHTSEKLVCNVCDKQFHRKSNLDVHMRIHTQDKPFACKVCDKQFSHKGYLDKHTKIHIGENYLPAMYVRNGPCTRFYPVRKYPGSCKVELVPKEVHPVTPVLKKN